MAAGSTRVVTTAATAVVVSCAVILLCCDELRDMGCRNKGETEKLTTRGGKKAKKGEIYSSSSRVGCNIDRGSLAKETPALLPLYHNQQIVC